MSLMLRQNAGRQDRHSNHSPQARYACGLYYIEQLNAVGEKMVSVCEKYERPVLKAHDAERKEILLYQPRCKQWDCASCANINKLLWQAKIGHGVGKYMDNGIDGWAMLTITAHERCTNFAQCLFPWVNQWAKLSSRMRRRHQGFKYVILPELHADNRIHWHLIASHNITERWLKDNARACGLGYIADASPIDNPALAIWYVSKYISKSLYGTVWLPNLKRIRTSQKWHALPPEDEFIPLDVTWSYLSTYPVEGMEYLRDEIEKTSGWKTRILSSTVTPLT